MARPNARATRYAAAAFGVARDDGTLDVWGEQLDRAAGLFDTAAAKTLLTSPTITAERKQAALNQALAGAPDKVLNFIGILAQHGRLALLPQVAQSFRRLANEHRGIQVAEVTTAVAIGDVQRQLIAGRLAARLGKQIVIETRVDPSILGGVVAQIGDDIIDGSVRGRIERMRRALLA